MALDCRLNPQARQFSLASAMNSTLRQIGRSLRKHCVLLLSVLIATLMISAGSVLLADHLCRSATAGRMFRSVEKVLYNDVGLVLGTGKNTKSGTPNLHFKQRIDAAVALYRSGKVRHLLVSGDNHVQGYDEPSDMRAALIAAGVPTNAITCDYAGFRTLDSVVRAQQVFGLTRCTIISEEFHCPRALWIAREHGLNAVAFAAPDLTSVRWSLRVKAREYLACAWCGVDLFVLHRGPKFPGPREPLQLAAKKQ
jgi:SanA protein